MAQRKDSSLGSWGRTKLDLRVEDGKVFIGIMQKTGATQLAGGFSGFRFSVGGDSLDSPAFDGPEHGITGHENTASESNMGQGAISDALAHGAGCNPEHGGALVQREHGRRVAANFDGEVGVEGFDAGFGSADLRCRVAHKCNQ